ncbi:hypothetical protein TrVE_jg11054 [Triparma verrucosa]|uniref:Methylthioribose-1-phosphate isomerase n=1 Tax=Triparma verrucosa TaxID=1606542 RepID=A0A9W7BUL0_9STRA|nr:hypothetical protein TrVE_jg11054 [Triparma verrucosa]
MSSSLLSLIYDGGNASNTPTLSVLDQRKVPHAKEYIPIKTCADAHRVIKDMNVRGAPLIALVALLGLTCDLAETKKGKDYAMEMIEFLKTSRPTAVNLFNAMEELTSSLNADTNANVDALEVTKTMAERYLAEDLAANKALGDFGAAAVKQIHPKTNKFNIMTICNTGSLATAGHGTALGIIRSLHATSSVESVGILETRPYNQGARLTAFEAVEEQWPNSTLIVDSATPSYMKKIGQVHCAVVGADRVAKNGDTANKIGTYHLALHCRYMGVPFYVASPTTTLDLEIETGAEIVIEERPADELRQASNAPPTIDTWNPAFDVTPASLITGIVTEKGVIYPDSSGKFDVVQFLADPSSAPAPPPLPTPLLAPPSDLLTTSTVPSYICSNLSSVSAVFPSSTTPSSLTAEEINGGNLNYAFVVKSKEGKSLFVKQAPDFVKCLGKDAKLHKERMELEVKTFETWLEISPASSKYLPKIYNFDVDNETFIMEFLGDCEMLEHRLINSPTFTPLIAKGLGEFMGLTHSASHVSQLDYGVAAEYFVNFKNEALRGLQLEYVFTKAFDEGGEKAKVLSESPKFMEGVAEMKRLYVGKQADNLALCHGDLHPGSVMINNDDGKVKIIDPEFAIYGPPGLDLGSLLSGVILATLHHKYLGNDLAAIKGLKAFVIDFITSYRKAAAVLGDSVLDQIVSDAIGFCSCEVARTALGFAGGRLWLQFDDAELKEKALAATVLYARKLMNERENGIVVLESAFDDLL